jgi:hypothetical protein
MADNIDTRTRHVQTRAAKRLVQKTFYKCALHRKKIYNSISGHKGERNFERIFEEASQISGTDEINDKFLSYLAHHATVEVYMQKMRDRTVTGEWIVFRKHNGMNYYLTLGNHTEDYGDIYSRAVLACAFDDFPFRLKKL